MNPKEILAICIACALAWPLVGLWIHAAHATLQAAHPNPDRRRLTDGDLAWAYCWPITYVVFGSLYLLLVGGERVGQWFGRVAFRGLRWPGVWVAKAWLRDKERRSLARDREKLAQAKVVHR